MHRALSSVFPIAVVVAAGCGTANASMDPLSDSELLSRVAAVLSVQEAPADRILGLHKGERVIVDVRCGDICPAYTVRIIRYTIDPGPACSRIGGDAALIVVPIAIGVTQQTFCIPHVLYARKLFIDHPYQK